MRADEAASGLDAPAGDPRLTAPTELAAPHPPGAGLRRQAPRPGAVDAGQARLLGPYRVIGAPLGAGGQGTVFLAEDTRLPRRVALKGLGSGAALSPSARGRLEQEAQLLAKLDHPGLCRIHELIEHEGAPYLVMEYIAGESLATRIALAREQAAVGGDPPPPASGSRKRAPGSRGHTSTPDRSAIDAILALVEEVARTLHVVHEASIVHRDVKPANIMIAEGESGARPHPILVDFGLARDLGTADPTLTATGLRLGTPAYQSPEQLADPGVTLDRRADLYSLGVTLYESLTLQRPFHAPTRELLHSRIRLQLPRDPRQHNPAIPADLVVVLEKALEKDRNRRYATTLELAEELRRVRQREPILARPTGWWRRWGRWVARYPAWSVTALVALALLVTAGLLLWQGAVVWGLAVLGSVAVVFTPVLAGWQLQRQATELEREQMETARQKSLAQANAHLSEEARRVARENERQARLERERALAREQEAEAARQRAARSADLASVERQQADANLRDLESLSDLRRLQEMRAEAADLWPAHPEHVDAMQAWRVRASTLARRLDAHRRMLTDLRAQAQPYTEEMRQHDLETHPARAELQGLRDELTRLEDDISFQVTSFPEGTPVQLEYRRTLNARIAALEQKVTERHTWRFADTEEQWRHDTLASLVRELEAFTDASPHVGEIASVQERMAFAEAVTERTLTGPGVRWRWLEARKDIRTHPAYGGLELSPQIGLVPIGKDPDSGLWEFAHLQSGVEPERDRQGRLQVTEETGIVLVLLPGGTFWMGAQREARDGEVEPRNLDPEAHDDEYPAHQVTLDPFLLSKYGMTQGQWLRASGSNPSGYGPDRYFAGVQHDLRHPVEMVSWFDCIRMARRLGLALPTEAQWEYACRASTGTPWWSGARKESLAGVANLADQALQRAGYGGPCEEWLDDGYAMHAPVGQLRANPWGLHDMHGNLWEWCQDGFAYYDICEARPGDGLREVHNSPARITRGGCYFLTSRFARSSCRSSNPQPAHTGCMVGVRLARRLEAP